MTMNDTPDIVAVVSLLAPTDGGRKSATPPDVFRCILVYHDSYYDCVLYLHQVGPVAPGKTVTVPIKFLCPDMIKYKLQTGDSFNLWEGKIIATGNIEKINRGEVIEGD